MKSLLPSLLVLSLGLGCAAPRDPELEKQVLLARKKKAEKPEDEGGSAPPQVGGPAMSDRPVKTLSGAEIAEILGAVPGQGPHVIATFVTAQGEIRCTLDERAPQTMANFVGLATGQLEWRPAPSDPPRKKRFYDGLTFHRIVHEFIIQTGNPTGRANAGPGWRVPREQGANELFLGAGAIGMIDDAGQTHGSQLFITAKPDRGLGNSYTAFGKCAPVALIKAISAAEKKANSDGKQPAVPVEIKAIRVERGS